VSDETNVLLTGRPGVGKTTVVESLVEKALGKGASVSGVVSPEMREEGERVGFRITDVSTGRSEVMAHIEYEGTSVGKYGVDVQALDSETPVVGVVQEGRETGFVGSVKERDDTTLVRVTEENRDEVPDDILSFVFEGGDSPQTF